MGETRVVSLRNGSSCPPTAPGYVRIDRGSKWGNPFIVGIDGTREEVIALYRDKILHGAGVWESMRQSVHELRGKELACWCAPLACHGDVLKEMADAE